MTVIKKPEVAFILSFFLPGAGLWYLDRWTWGFANLAAVVGVILILLQLPLGTEVFEYFQYIVLALHAASAGFAHAVASDQTMERAVPR